ncbi:hypothetical protein O181_019568 [Austropuccinia psidii MF-1]|uniref:Uncharacterized protein n=1 Tax=Austropuccinia psidii MF-1 TaxID=1389203 RepID=A0A9Q3C9W3_9BASI|nr:hypothetical protein [Austropuccinia psidii MF-1]
MAIYTHQGGSRVTRRRLTSCQANVKQDKSQAHVKQKSSKLQAHVPLLSYTKSCDIHAFNSDCAPPHHPTTIRWLVKITQDPPVCTNTHQRGPPASLDVGGGFDFTWSSMKGLRRSGVVILQMTLVEPSAQYRGCGCVCVTGTSWRNDVLSQFCVAMNEVAQQEWVTWLDPIAQCSGCMGDPCTQRQYM